MMAKRSLPIAPAIFAEVRAKLDAGLPREDAVPSAIVDWQSLEEEMLIRLADAADRGEMGPLREYSESYSRTRSALTGDTSEGITETAQVVAPAQGPFSLSRERERAVPSVQTTEIDRGAIRAALPFQAGSLATPRPSVPVVPHESAGTVEIPVAAVRAALPFGAQPERTAPIPRPVPPSPAPPVERADTEPLARTSFLAPAVGRTPREAETMYLRAEAQPGIAIPFAKGDPTKGRAVRNKTVALPPPGRGMTHAPTPEASGRAVTPFTDGSASLMPLERYAEIHAQLVLDEDPQVTFSKLSLDPGTWMNTVRSYTAKLLADRALKAYFDDLVEKELKHGRK